MSSQVTAAYLVSELFGSQYSLNDLALAVNLDGCSPKLSGQSLIAGSGPSFTRAYEL